MRKWENNEKKKFGNENWHCIIDKFNVSLVLLIIIYASECVIQPQSRTRAAHAFATRRHGTIRMQTAKIKIDILYMCILRCIEGEEEKNYKPLDAKWNVNKKVFFQYVYLAKSRFYSLSLSSLPATTSSRLSNSSPQFMIYVLSRIYFWVDYSQKVNINHFFIHSAEAESKYFT